MSTYRNALPQLSGDLFVTDGGIETTLIFHDGLDLPEFAAFILLGNDEGREALYRYFRSYAEVARDQRVNLVIDSATWRANPDWATTLGYDADALAGLTRASVEVLKDVRDEFASDRNTIVLGGAIGPRGDGYVVGDAMTAQEAQQYHTPQVRTFADTAVDMVSAITMTYAEEAIGIARAAKAHGLPCVIAFTVETDGRLPSGITIQEAIAQVDAATDKSPAYYMINCAHPTHFDHALEFGAEWMTRVRGIKANASSMSHEELGACEELDEGHPVELGAQLRDLRDRHPYFNVLGGCCGTDHRHISEIAKACTSATV